MAAPIPFSEVARLDSELVRLARGASAVRLAVGNALDALASSGGHHELGFSSLGAYARERCERTGRWAADTQALARKLQLLPRIREALRAGEIGWSTAGLLARHVTADSELEWLERARRATVRELRLLLVRRSNPEAADVDTEADAEESDPTHALTLSATREDGWMFECARKVAEAVAGPTTSDRLLQMLLAEGYSSLLELVPESVRCELYEIDGLECDMAAESEAQASWCAERRRWRDEAEELCEPETRRMPPAPDWAPCSAGEIAGPAGPSSKTPEALDRAIRRMCSELSERDLAFGIVAESARKAEVWRRLGFATEAHYARERLGVSLSSLKAKRVLAARAGHVPELATALSSGRLGYEAAYLLSRVVTPKTAGEWIRRAERRTVKHLREEVEAAELLIRMGLARDQSPLDDRSLDAFFELERCIASGDLLEREQVPDGGAAECETRSTARVFNRETPCGTAGQMSGAARGARLVRRFGRVRMRWVVSEATHRFWRALERVFVRVNARVCHMPASFLRFLCETFCRVWLPALRRDRLTESGEQPEYFRVYRRDVFRCASPVCTRRDVTPHHLEFRSHGGGDEDENLASLCVWCHLRGVHEGRLAAGPPASRIRWRIGRAGTLWVEGRTRVAVAPACG